MGGAHMPQALAPPGRSETHLMEVMGGRDRKRRACFFARRQCGTSAQMNLLTRVVALACLSLLACGPATVAKATVEKNAMDSLTRATGMTSPQVTCPGDLTATVGATMVCAITLSDKVYDVNVAVTAVMDGTASFSVMVASMPRP